MDFFTIKQRPGKGYIEVYPDFKICRSRDLMVKGKTFCAIWDEEAGLWSTDIYDAQRLIDKELDDYASKLVDGKVKVQHLSSFNNTQWMTFLKYMGALGDNYKLLDRKITFMNEKPNKTDYISRKLEYAVEPKDTPAYTELTTTLYEPEEIEKFEWIIGSIIAGDSRSIQKFLVFYGATGTGKSTIIHIIEKLFDGYFTTFNAKALGNSGSEFAMEPFRLNPLVAIQHDGDLSRIEDNTRLNSITSHESMTINIKHKSMYMDTFTSMLIMGTNKPVKITDAQSGIIRRLIDVTPKGVKIPVRKYDKLFSQVQFELGGIAQHCLDVYRKLGKNYYNNYIPMSMIQKTDVFFNYIKEYYDEYVEAEYVTLKKAWADYKEYCEFASIKYDMPMYKFREELKEYFINFDERVKFRDDTWGRNVFSGFKASKIYIDVTKKDKPTKEEKSLPLVLDCDKSLLDSMLEDCPAQYAKDDGTPVTTWRSNQYCLKDLDTKELHYVKPPMNHIVIDFDIKNDKGEKDFNLNAEAASLWPPTYAELSKGGQGIHLHYIYQGDAEQLAALYDKDIEIKVFKGNSALRRKLTRCNNIPVASISVGSLPLAKKVNESVVDFTVLKNEKALETYIRNCMQKKYPPHATKPMIDYISDSLDKAYQSGMDYDLSRYFNDVYVFASQSTHNKEYCMKKVMKMKWKSKSAEEDNVPSNTESYEDDRLVFFDIEVFPNLFLVVWKYDGSDKHVVMVNPSPEEVKRLLKLKLIGFNCRRYDNHIIYAAAIGYSVNELYNLSKMIIKEQKGFAQAAYNLSYADIYDFSTRKQSLKRFEIELGIHHQELPLDWNEDVPDDRIDEVISYCKNDVDATETVFHAKIPEDDWSCEADFHARCIMAELSGKSPNDTTRICAEQFIFGDDRNPQTQFVYTDLSEMFPGYKFDNGVSTYLGEIVGEGGYVYAEPGAYGYVPVKDVASMHPHSMIALNIFGDKYTKRLKELVEARIAVKHKDKTAAKKLLDGVLVQYMTSDADCKSLAYALKIIINSIYGLTAASFPNRFRDPRNIDNIVAKRGALFMCTLKHKVQEKGYKVVHIKTDSIKIANPDEEILKFVDDFGKKYGYTFEIEEEFERFLLVNNAVYVGKTKEGKWTATGAEFIHPVVFKMLFTKEPLDFKDLCETKQVQTEIYLDFNEKDPNKHMYHFVGRVGAFIPVKEGCGGGVLLRKVNVDDNIPVETILDEEYKMSAVTGTKGYRWKEAEVIKDNYESQIDWNYYNCMTKDAKDHISEFCDYELFVSEDTFIANNIVYAKKDIPFDV